MYYLGTANPKRIENILLLNEYLKNKEVVLEGHLHIAPYREEKAIGGISFSHNSMEYRDYIEKIKKCDVIIDMVYDNHKGLSFRFFEALYYNKKIITNNKDVVKYDFYNPNNVFICDYKNFEGIEFFLEKPYFTVSKEVSRQYSIDNWINNMLGLADRKTIKLVSS